MSKKKKVISIILGIISIAVISTIAFVWVFPKIYLARKYDTKMNDYRVESFTPGYFMYDIDYWAVKWHNPRWTVKTKNRKFNVIYLYAHLYDDYQMEDVEEWVVEEFKDKIDNNICFVGINSYNTFGLYNYDSNIVHISNTLWTKENISSFISNLEQPLIYLENTDVNSSQLYRKEIETKMIKYYGENYMYSKIYVCKNRIKPKRVELKQFYTSPAYYSHGLNDEDIVELSD